MAFKNTPANIERNQNPLASFQNEMNSFFDRFMKEFLPERGQDHFMPRVEVQDSGNSYLVSAELPGIKEQDLDISFDNNTLILQGEKKQESKKEGKGYYRSEISYGSFYRAIPLASDVNPEKISANLDNGILKVEIQKNLETASKAKKIQIGSQTKH